MCKFISVWLPKGTDKDKLASIYKKNGKNFANVGRRHDVPDLDMVLEEYDPGPARHCDCDSYLGRWGVNLFEKLGYPLKYRRRLFWRRFKGRLRGEDVEKITMKSIIGEPERDFESIKEDNDLRIWMDIVDKSINGGIIEGIGLLLNWGDDTDIFSVECLTMEEVTEETLLRMRLDTLYVFSKKKTTQPVREGT